MGVPETIVAAGIGGAATVTAALFQLYTAVRVKSEKSPKKASALRSSFATLMLMIASAAGGYVYADYRLQQALDDARAVHEELRAMRDEINAQLLVLAQTTGRLVQEHGADDDRRAGVDLPALEPVPAACDDAVADASASCAAAAPPETSTVTPHADGLAL